jgi:hypothetical protein
MISGFQILSRPSQKREKTQRRRHFYETRVPGVHAMLTQSIQF